MDAVKTQLHGAFGHSMPGSHSSVAGLGAALWRRKGWIIVPTLLAFLGALAGVNLLPVRYTGEARVLLENRETVYSRPERDTRGTDPAIDPEAVASQVQIVMSKDLAIKVIRDLGLNKLAEFDPIANGINPIKAAFMILGLSSDPRLVPLDERVLETYYKRLLVFPQGKSRVISIEFQSEDAALAAAVANRIAEEYLRREEGAKGETSRVTSDWLDKAIEPLMKRVVAAEAKVEAFRSSRGLFIGSNNMTITNQQLAELNSQLATARSLQADLQSRAKLIREALRLGRVFETSEINNNELVRRLLEQRAQLKAQIAFDERTLLAGHPRMKELSSQLRDLEEPVRSAAERAARAFDNDSRAAGARVESLQAELNLQKKSATLSNEGEVQLKSLEREATALREQLNSYRNKFLDAAARASDNPSPADARIISRATAQNEPTFPKKLPIVLLATLGTLVLTSTLIAASHLMARQAAFDRLDGREDFDPRLHEPAGRASNAPHAHASMSVQTPETAEPSAISDLPAGMQTPAARQADAKPDLPWHRPAHTKMPFKLPFGIGQARDEVKLPDWPVPAQSPTPATPAREPAASGISQQSSRLPDEIAVELGLLGYLGRAKILIVHGLESGANTPLQTMRIGRRLARDGATLVIDLMGKGDLFARAIRRGSDADGGTSTAAKGLADYLQGFASPGEIIHRDQGSAVHILPAGLCARQQMLGPAEREEIVALVDLLAQSYAHIVIDSGVAGGTGEMIADLADAFVLLTLSDEEGQALRQCANRLELLRGSPVYVAPDDSVPTGSPANDRGRSWRSSAA